MTKDPLLVEELLVMRSLSPSTLFGENKTSNLIQTPIQSYGKNSVNSIAEMRDRDVNKVKKRKKGLMSKEVSNQYSRIFLFAYLIFL